MKKNSTLQQKLKSYSAVAGAVAATAVVTDANAQIVYTDVNPDLTVTATSTGAGFNLDLDNNGVVDFVVGAVSGIFTYTSSSGGTMQFPYNLAFAYTAAPTTNMMDTIAPDGFTVAHNTNDNISAVNLWDNSGQFTLGYDFTTVSAVYGQWPGATDKYLALKFDIGGTTHYGWARLTVSADAGTITLKDFAYESTANLPILAGATSSVTGIASLELKDVNVFSYERKVNINLGEVKDATISITDMAGREVSSVQLNSGSTQIDLSNVSAGIYMVSVNSAEGRTTAKISIQ
jgi:hypothetical protein